MTKLIIDTAYDLYKQGLLSKEELVQILEDLINAAAMDNGYAEKYGLPCQ